MNSDATIFATSAKGHLAGVFEYDGETGYFYLCEPNGAEGHKVLDSIHIFSGPSNFGQNEISVRWDDQQSRVGLFLGGTLWAVLNVETRAKSGGNYRPDTRPEISVENNFVA